jgi:hypothetical protein
VQADDGAERVPDEMRALDLQPVAHHLHASRRIARSRARLRCLAERPLPGRSGRIARWRARAPITGVQLLEVPPRPCTRTIGFALAVDFHGGAVDPLKAHVAKHMRGFSSGGPAPGSLPGRPPRISIRETSYPK